MSTVSSSEDYQRVLDRFLTDIEAEIGNDIVSVLLYGSMACGDLKPGKSDIDLWLFLRQEPFEDKTLFFRMLEHLIELGRQLSHSGVPFNHPFHYYSEDEIGYVPSYHLPDLQSESSAKVVLGQDIRPQLRSSISSHYTAKAGFFTHRTMHCSILSRYLEKDTLNKDNVDFVLYLLKIFASLVPQCACWALDIQVSQAEALSCLQKALSDVETSVIERIQTHLNQTDPTADIEHLQTIIREALIFIEDLHDRISPLWAEQKQEKT